MSAHARSSQRTHNFMIFPSSCPKRDSLLRFSSAEKNPKKRSKGLISNRHYHEPPVLCIVSLLLPFSFCFCNREPRGSLETWWGGCARSSTPSITPREWKTGDRRIDYGLIKPLPLYLLAHSSIAVAPMSGRWYFDLGRYWAVVSV